MSPPSPKQRAEKEQKDERMNKKWPSLYRLRMNVSSLIRGSLRTCVLSVSGRWKVFVFMNSAFFGGVLVTVLLTEFVFQLPLYAVPLPQASEFLLENHWFLVLLYIFVSNLVLSAFLVVTLPGIVFFPLSSAFLLFRAFIWGSFIRLLPTWAFLIAVPTLVLEGEAYAFAAVAGTVVGASWIKPSWLYGEVGFTRTEAFKKALKECLAIYVFVAAVLFVAATVEAITLTMVVL